MQRTKRTQRARRQSTPPASPLDRAIGNLNAVVATHAQTTQYALNVLRTLQLAGERIPAAERERIAGAALAAFRIEGLAVADASSTVDRTIDELADAAA